MNVRGSTACVDIKDSFLDNETITILIFRFIDCLKHSYECDVPFLLSLDTTKFNILDL